MAITAVSGKITVTTTKTAVAGPDSGPGTFFIWADPTNTGTYCYVGNDGSDDVWSTTGYSLKKGVNWIVLSVSNLSEWYFDSDTSGDRIQYVKVAAEGWRPPGL